MVQETDDDDAFKAHPVEALPYEELAVGQGIGAGFSNLREQQFPRV